MDRRIKMLRIFVLGCREFDFFHDIDFKLDGQDDVKMVE